MAQETPEQRDRWTTAGVLVPAGLFIGMGIGWVVGYLVPGLFVGLGAGFLAMALVRLAIRDEAARWSGPTGGREGPGV